MSFFLRFLMRIGQSSQYASVTGREQRTLQLFFSRWFRRRLTRTIYAVGRMNVVQVPGKAPRLIVDSSLCGANGACYVPESYQLPLLESIRFSSPLRECSSVIGGFSLDIRAAHKTVRVRERDRGVLGVGLPVGDSHGFQRVSGFLVRFLHVLIWVRHMLMMYSDDLLMAQDEAVLPLMSSLVLAACAVFGYPIS